MADIEMCLSQSCPSSRQCIRHKDSGTKPSFWQAYGPHEPDETGKCDWYWPVRDDNEENKND